VTVPPANNPPTTTGEGTVGDLSVDLTVLFFAAAREAAGTPRAALRVAAGTDLGVVTERLRSSYGPALAGVMSTSAVWLNGAPAAASTVVVGGDEVAVLPPVSGGDGPGRG